MYKRPSVTGADPQIFDWGGGGAGVRGPNFGSIIVDQPKKANLIVS